MNLGFLYRIRSIYQRANRLAGGRPWAVSLIGVVAIAVLIWFGAPYIKISGNAIFGGVGFRLSAIAVVFLIWGAVQLWRFVKARQSNAALADGMVSAGEAGTAGAHEDVDAMDQRMTEALELLKRTSGSSFGGQYLYELPWYVVIGPPGSGKTTALENSGLKFPLSDKFGSAAIQGVGGTRNCDWWFGEDAVFLDTAGRYTTQDSHEASDSAAWRGFLQLLRRNRPRRPINGVVVTLSLFDLVTQSEHERGLHARAVRSRIEELREQLGVRVPVYMLFTKVDLIAGFTEFFDNLGREERDQLWGLTFPWGSREDRIAPLERFGVEFGALVRRLNERVLWRFRNERDVARRALVYGFPQRFEGLQPILEQFLQQAFGAHRFETAPLLRGVYFCSGEQKGQPIDKLDSAVEGSFGLAATEASQVAVDQKHSFFLRRFFQDVLISEAELVGVNVGVEKARIWSQRAVAAIGLVAIIAGIVAWTTSYSTNQARLQEMAAGLAAFEQARAELGPQPYDMHEVGPMLDTLRNAVTVFDPERATWKMGFGLYLGDEFYDDGIDAYGSVLRRYFLPGLSDQFAHQLRTGPKEPEFQLEALRAYLMLALPERLDPRFVQAWAVSLWKQAYPQEPAFQARLRDHLAVMFEHTPLITPVDDGLVAQARELASQVPMSVIAYLRLKSEAEQVLGNPLDLAAIAGDQWDQLFVSAAAEQAPVTVHRVFTRPGLETFYVERDRAIARAAVEDNWVLGPRAAKSYDDDAIERLARQMEDLYIREYVKTWQDVLGALKVRPPQGLNDLASSLALAHGPKSPLVKTLDTVRANTVFEHADTNGKQQENALGNARDMASAASADWLAAQPAIDTAFVELSFSTLNAVTSSIDTGVPRTQDLVQAIGALYAEIQLISQSPEPNRDALKLVAREMRADAKSASAQLRQIAGRSPNPVSSWLLALNNNALGSSLGAAREELNAVWRGTVYADCRATLAKRYPFYRSSSDQVTVGDFENFFGPGKALDRFVSEHLSPFVNTRRWSWRNIDGMAISDSSGFLVQLRRAAQLRDSFFRGGASFNVPFELKPSYLDERVGRLDVNIGGQSLTYRHGPQRPSSFVWPAKGAGSTAELSMETLSGRRFRIYEDGPWAFFKLLERGDLKRLSSDRYRIRFEQSGYQADLELRAASAVNPFGRSDMFRFRCPGSM
ncbi:MAG: type VI secretion system membrane subunit TssM [Pseudomonadota bacterium]|nr:type VI secretion system membrane subunit TssM [Pseudomonadota bacterium]